MIPTYGMLVKTGTNLLAAGRIGLPLLPLTVIGLQPEKRDWGEERVLLE